MKELRNYIYMDMIGIDSLLSQITSELIETNHIQTTNRKMGTAKGNIGFSELVRKIFKADASLSGELESVQVIDKTTTLPYEAKIEQIITYIEKHKILLKNKIDITQNYQEEKQNFVLLVMSFDTDFYRDDWFKTVDLVNQFGYIPFYLSLSMFQTASKICVLVRTMPGLEARSTRVLYSKRVRLTSSPS